MSNYKCPDLNSHRHNILSSIKEKEDTDYDKKRPTNHLNDVNLMNKYKKIYSLLYPQSFSGLKKIRIGGPNDGGYIMADPGMRGGIAYSFGVSNYSPWDMEMANRGFKVFQFDGTIKGAPEEHPNLQFFRYNISGKNEHAPNAKSLPEIFEMLNHQNENDIILQCDIEGAEWDLFDNINSETLKKFQQIIVEFHCLYNREEIERYYNIFNKLVSTHAPIHFHYNNHATIWVFDDFIMSNTWEVTFLRRDNLIFKNSNEVFPTALDDPNNYHIPDLYIGDFKYIIS